MALDDDRVLVDMQDDFPKRFTVQSYEEKEQEEKVAKRKREEKAAAANKPKTSASIGSISASDLKQRMITVEAPKQLERKKEDLNGIEPTRPFTFALVAAAMAFGLWALTTYMAGHFAIEYVDSEFYPLQRFAIFARNVVVGITTLGAGFSGIITLGLVALGVTVAQGVARGELDPNAVVEEQNSKAEP